MSRWLQNVGNFLEKLDDQAEHIVEEQTQGTGALSEEHDEIRERAEVAGVHLQSGTVVPVHPEAVPQVEPERAIGVGPERRDRKAGEDPHLPILTRLLFPRPLF